MKRRLFHYCSLISFVALAWCMGGSHARAADADEGAADKDEGKLDSYLEEAAKEKEPLHAENDDSHHGLFGALRIGPTASVGFPFLLNYGLDATWDRSFGVALSGGHLSRELKKDQEVEVFNWDLRGRWFPWQGSFFIGAAYGNQGIVGKAKEDLKVKSSEVELKVPTTLRLEINNTYLTPHLGWFATWDSGFTLGFELGYQMPLSSKAKLQTAFDDVSSEAETTVRSSDEYKKAKKDIETAAEAFGKKGVPYVNLLRLGWLL